MPAKHYKYGGSTAARTIACPGWADLTASMPPSSETVSEYALEGTALHTCMEMLLDGDVDKPEHLLGRTVDGVTIDADHVIRLDMALDAWDELCKRAKIHDYEVEQTYELTDQIGGTTDVLAWSSDWVFVVDWKFGQGIEVSAENNKQGLFYAACAEYHQPELFEGRKLAVVIIQPIPSRPEHETLDVWALDSMDVFSKFKRDFFASVEDDSKTLSAGDHCKFCPAAPVCPQKTGQARAALMLDLEDSKKVAEALELAFELESWIKEVKDYAHKALEQGSTIEGFKLVPKRATRKWLNEAEAEKKLRKIARRSNNDFLVSDMHTKKLITPSMFEKLAKQKGLDTSEIGDYIISQSSGTTLAPDSDRRGKVPSTASFRAAMDRLK